MATLARGLWAVRSAVDRYGDFALAGGLSVGALVEATSEAQGFPPLTLLTTLPLAWRRRWPMAVMLFVFLGAAVSRQAPYIEIACAAVAAYSVGAHAKRRLPGLAQLIAISLLVIAFLGGGGLPPVPDFLGPFIVLLPLWLVGNAIRQGRARTEALAERAHRLEREQELTLRAAQAEERSRIARELHDVVAHSVSVMVVQAGAARQVLKQSPERSSAALLAVEDTGREAMHELRQILGILGQGEPNLGPQPGLAQLPALIETVHGAGLPVEMEVKGGVRALSPRIELTAYRVIQEALTNAVKHSGLATTRVAIEYRPQELKLEILCDGHAVLGDGSPGRGIPGMKERVALVGGRLEVGPGLERGYNVRAWLPMTDAT